MRFIEQLFWIAGIIFVGWFCFGHVQAYFFQTTLNQQLNEELAQSHVVQQTPPTRSQGTTSSLIGRIDIPRLKLSAIIEEGDDSFTLHTAVGHIPGTALPGGTGNVGLAAHRDSFFRGLAKVRDGDVIVVTTVDGTFRYRVESTGVVPPEQVSVLNPLGVPALTLVTCYPFHFVGPAPERYIVTAFQAKPVDQARSDG